EVARKHRGASHDISRTIGGLRDGIREDTFERARSHLAEEYAREEILLGLGRPRHEPAQRAAAVRRGTCARCRDKEVEKLVDAAAAGPPTAAAPPRQRTPTRPCRGFPMRSPTAGAIASGSSCKSSAESLSTFDRRERVDATASAVVTSLLSSIASLA